jgi:hypothetical protein
MTENYAQPGKEAITLAVDRLQQDVGTQSPISLCLVFLEGTGAPVVKLVDTSYGT